MWYKCPTVNPFTQLQVSIALYRLIIRDQSNCLVMKQWCNNSGCQYLFFDDIFISSLGFKTLNLLLLLLGLSFVGNLLLGQSEERQGKKWFKSQRVGCDGHCVQAGPSIFIHSVGLHWLTVRSSPTGREDTRLKNYQQTQQAALTASCNLELNQVMT